MPPPQSLPRWVPPQPAQANVPAQPGQPTQVATNIAGNLPVLGPTMQKLIVGGPVYGHHTLTRFFALHVAILPPLIVVLMIAHIAVFRRHGVTTPRSEEHTSELQSQ